MGKGEFVLCLFVLLMSRDCCVALLHDAMGLSAVCGCVFPDHTHLLFLKICMWFLYNPQNIFFTFCELRHFPAFNAIDILSVSIYE